MVLLSTDFDLLNQGLPPEGEARSHSLMLKAHLSVIHAEVILGLYPELIN